MFLMISSDINQFLSDKLSLNLYRLLHAIETSHKSAKGIQLPALVTTIVVEQAM
jgi:hypothetical protein